MRTIEFVEELLLQKLEEELVGGGNQIEIHLFVSSLTNRIVFDHLYRWDDVPDLDEEE